MKTKHIVTIGLLLVISLSATGLAVHFYSRAGALDRELEAVKGEAVRLHRELTEAGRTRQPEVAQVPALEEKQPVVAAISDDHAATLSNQVAELEALLNDRDRLIASLQQQPTNRASSRRRFDRNEWMNRLQKEDPDRYKEIIQAREEARKRVDQAFAKKSTHFLGQDTDAMTEKEKEKHELMLKLLNDTWAISEKLQKEDVPRDERRDLRREMFTKVMTLNPMLEEERTREFRALGTQLGYTEEENKEFVQYLNDVIEVTSARSFFSRGSGRGRPGRSSRDRNTTRTP